MRDSRYILVGLCFGLLLALPPLFAADEGSSQFPCKGLARVAYSALVHELKGHHTHYQPTTNEQNIRFRDHALYSPEGKYHYFHIDFAPLRILNNRILGDREVSHALSNLYKKILYEEMAKSALLQKNMKDQYSDWKSLRIGFTGDPVALDKAMNEAYEQAADRLHAEVMSHPSLVERFIKEAGLVSNPRWWFVMGIGNTADRASLRARMTRQSYTPEAERAPVLAYETQESRGQAFARFVRASEHRAILERELGVHKDLFVSTSSGTRVPSTALFEILVRAAQAESAREALDELKEKVHIRFGVKLTDTQALLLQNYFNSVDTFTPPVYGPTPATIQVGSAKNGILWMDVSGQNADNLNQAAVQLAEAMASGVDTPERLDMALVNLRQGQQQASGRFEMIEKAFESVVHGTDIPPDNTFAPNGIRMSGDEGGFAPARPLADVDLKRIVWNFAHMSPVVPSRMRLLYLDPKFPNGSKVSETARSAFLKSAETSEKDLRWYLEANGVSREAQQGMNFLIRIEPLNQSRARIHVYVGGAKGDSELLQKVRQGIRRSLPQDWSLTSVIEVDHQFMPTN